MKSVIWAVIKMVHSFGKSFFFGVEKNTEHSNVVIDVFGDYTKLFSYALAQFLILKHVCLQKIIYIFNIEIWSRTMSKNFNWIFGFGVNNILDIIAYEKNSHIFVYRILTWVSVRLKLSARLRRSHTERYRVVLNLFSNETSCSYVKAVLALEEFGLLLAFAIKVFLENKIG